MNKNKKTSLLLHIITPLIVFLVCAGAILLISIKPYNKISVYLNLAFMDKFQTSPNEGVAGLVIRENDIDTNYKGDTFEEGEIVRPVYGEQFAVLKSSAFELSVPVYWGSGRELFERGACQASYSKLPGDSGNTVISAHVDTFFAELSKLKAGDTVTITTTYGEFTYEVSELIEFKKTNKKYVASKQEDILTLYTCKKDVLGASEDRIGVICTLTEEKFFIEKEAQ